jgi:hypothetical protein
VRVGDAFNVILLTADPVRGFIDFAREDTALSPDSIVAPTGDELRSPYRGPSGTDRRAGD